MTEDSPPVVPPTEGDARRQPDQALLSGIDVYWRPRCFFCLRLRRALRRAGVIQREHNIWQDQRAREFVRRHADGNETVPTVVVADHVFVNPRPRTLLAKLRTRSADEPRPDRR